MTDVAEHRFGTELAHEAFGDDFALHGAVEQHGGGALTGGSGTDERVLAGAPE